MEITEAMAKENKKTLSKNIEVAAVLAKTKLTLTPHQTVSSQCLNSASCRYTTLYPSADYIQLIRCQLLLFYVVFMLHVAEDAAYIYSVLVFSF